MRRNQLLPGILLGFVFLLLASANATPARAANCSVPSSSFPTIASAVQSGGCSLISIGAGTFNESNIQIKNSTTIQGAGPGSTIIDGQSQGTIFTILPGATVTISGVRMRNGSGVNGGAINNQGALTVQNSGMHHNQASNQGGAIYSSGSSLQLFNVNLTYNQSSSGGGAIYQTSGALTVSGGLITNNTAGDSGGGIHSASGTLNVTAATFQQNSTSQEGGGIYTSVATQITGSLFLQNNSGTNGAGVEQDGAPSTVTITNSIFRGNQAKGWGGAMENEHGNVTITDSIFSHNSARGSGALDNDGGTLYISGSTFRSNLATYDIDGGGAIWTSIPTTVVNSTFYNNQAQNGQGGAINADGNLVTLLNDTFASNTAPTGGNVSATTGTLHIQNSILTGGQPNNCAAISGTLQSLGSNLSSDASCETYFSAAGDMNKKDPMLGTIQNNGGFAPTMLPGTNSPALNAVVGGCPPPNNDQRGVARPQGPSCDIGAVEVSP